MRRFIARKMIAAFGAKYRYDVSYMRAMLETSPTAFFRFLEATKLSRHAEAAPKAALAAARLVGAMSEDCGPCVQIVVDMAREAGVADADIAAILSRDIHAMSEDAAIGFVFADRVARREDADAIRDEVRTKWGDKGVLDLTFAVQGSRLFPMIKSGMGYAKECVRVTVGERPVAVAKAA
jgi:alkylhydroperoxidase family enzyme